MKRSQAIILEYNNIKQEIFSLKSRIDQLLIVEYTIAIALLAAGYQLDNSFFFFLVHLFTIAIQSMVNRRRLHMARASVYIEKYIETEVEYLKWETFIKKADIKYQDRLNFMPRIFARLEDAGSLVIMLSAIIMYIVNILDIGVHNAYIHCDINSFLGLIIMLLTSLIIIKQYCKYINFKKLGDDYYKIMMGIKRDET